MRLAPLTNGLAGGEMHTEKDCVTDTVIQRLYYGECITETVRLLETGLVLLIDRHTKMKHA